MLPRWLVTFWKVGTPPTSRRVQHHLQHKSEVAGQLKGGKMQHAAANYNVSDLPERLARGFQCIEVPSVAADCISSPA